MRISPLQACELQGLPSSTTPSHRYDSSGGDWQVRVRVCIPPPQSLLHCAHWPQMLQPPKTHTHTHNTTQNLALTVKPMWSCVLGFSIILTHSRKAHRYAPNVAVAMENQAPAVCVIVQTKASSKKKKENYFEWENSYKKSYSYRKHKMYMPSRSTGTATD